MHRDHDGEHVRHRHELQNEVAKTLRFEGPLLFAGRARREILQLIASEENVAYPSRLGEEEEGCEEVRGPDSSSRTAFHLGHVASECRRIACAEQLNEVVE